MYVAQETKHKISGTDGTAALADCLRKDYAGTETAIGKHAFRTIPGQSSDGKKGTGDFAE